MDLSKGEIFRLQVQECFDILKKALERTEVINWPEEDDQVLQQYGEKYLGYPDKVKEESLYWKNQWVLAGKPSDWNLQERMAELNESKGIQKPDFDKPSPSTVSGLEAAHSEKVNSLDASKEEGIGHNEESPVLDNKQAAKYLSVSPSTLNHSRSDGILGGRAAPMHKKIGRKVFYVKRELDAWFESAPNLKSTSDNNNGNQNKFND